MLSFVFYTMKFKPKQKFIKNIANGLNNKYTVMWDVPFDSVTSEQIVIIYGILHGNEQVIQACISKNIRFLYIDNAYYTPLKGQYYSVSLNSPQTLWELKNKTNYDYNIQTKQYNLNGTFVLISPADEDFMAKWMNTNCMQYMHDTINNIRTFTDAKIRIRLKPHFPPGASKLFRNQLLSMIEKDDSIELSSSSLNEDLSECIALCTPFSRIVMEALTFGKPVICTSSCFASEISEPFSILKDGLFINETKIPEFLHKVKNSQFHIKELQSGVFFEKLSSYVL